METKPSVTRRHVRSANLGKVPVFRAWPLTLLPTTVLPPGLQATRVARAHLTRLARGWSTERLDVARLLISELVTNAVLHGEGEVELTIRGAAGAIRVEVSDRNPHLRPTPGRPGPRPRFEGGRGLQIVAAAADDWGSCPDGPGKTVWFQLRCG